MHLDGFESCHLGKRKEKSHPVWDDFYFSGCGRRTRTSDLRVMSPTSYQLLYPAIFKVPDYYSFGAIKMQALSSGIRLMFTRC